MNKQIIKINAYTDARFIGWYFCFSSSKLIPFPPPHPWPHQPGCELIWVDTLSEWFECCLQLSQLHIRHLSKEVLFKSISFSLNNFRFSSFTSVLCAKNGGFRSISCSHFSYLAGLAPIFFFGYDITEEGLQAACHSAHFHLVLSTSYYAHNNCQAWSFSAWMIFAS